jgi:hypothetical protein
MPFARVARLRRRFAPGAITTVTACAGLGLLAASPGGAKAVLATCSPAKLAVKLISFQGATGHRYWQLAFRNTGSPCKLHGYPGVTLLSTAGYVVRLAVKHEPGPLPTVSVSHGGLAHFTFSYVDGGFCKVHVTGTRLRLFAPGAVAGYFFNPVPANHGPLSVCSNSAMVSPLRSHPGS